MSDTPRTNPISVVRLALLALALGLIIFGVIRALPPRVVTIEVGPVGGSYYDTALKYRAALRQHGLDVELRVQPDSMQIINDVNRVGSGVDIGFTAQVVQREQFPNAAAAGAIELQPLFTFYNDGLGELEMLTSLRGKRIVLPPERSATSDVALRVLRLFDVTPANTSITFMPLADAVSALRADKFDAGMFLLAPTNNFIDDLLNDDNLRLLGTSGAKGITRHLPFLRTVVVPRGSYSVDDNLPPNDVPLLAATVDVVVRKDIQPAVLYMLLEAMREVHHGATLVSEAGDFPSIVGTDLLPHRLAASYAKSGLPWVYQALPLPIASLIDTYLIVGVLLFISTEIYKSLRYLAEMTTLVLETLCLHMLRRIARAAERGQPVSFWRRVVVRLIERVALRFKGSQRTRSEELIGRIRSSADLHH